MNLKKKTLKVLIVNFTVSYLGITIITNERDILDI